MTILFQANFLLTPPVPGARVSASGEPDATALIAWCLQLDYAVVDFNNNWRDYTFGDGGLFRLMFLDLGPIVHDGSYDLRARIKLIDCPEEGDGSGSGGPTPVPEPATVVLLGSGLIGLFYMAAEKPQLVLFVCGQQADRPDGRSCFFLSPGCFLSLLPGLPAPTGRCGKADTHVRGQTVENLYSLASQPRWLEK